MGRTYGAAKSPAVDPFGSAAGDLPASYSPIVAGYARGPFLDPETVTPTQWRWRNTRTYLVRNSIDGLDYRAVRVENDGGKFLGYWAVELLGTPLTLGVEFDTERDEAIARHEEKSKYTGGTPWTA